MYFSGNAQLSRKLLQVGGFGKKQSIALELIFRENVVRIDLSLKSKALEVNECQNGRFVVKQVFADKFLTKSDIEIILSPSCFFALKRIKHIHVDLKTLKVKIWPQVKVTMHSLKCQIYHLLLDTVGIYSRSGRWAQYLSSSRLWRPKDILHVAKLRL